MNDNTHSGQVLGDQDPSVDLSMYDDLGGGIASSFPVISYRSSRWRVRWQGAEELLVDAQNRPVEEIGVCLVRVPNHKSKRYWIGGFKNDNRAPDCWSTDSIRPHPTLTPPDQPQGWRNPRPTVCADCYWDQFGTSMRQDGSVGRGKACADYKRCAVKIYYPDMPIGFEAAEGQLFLMQVPPDSLQTLKKYGEDLAREHLAAAATVTFVGLVINDQKISYPKLTFRKGPKLSSEELQNIRLARESTEATRILNEEIAFIEPEALAYEATAYNNGGEQQPEEQAPVKPTVRMAPPAPPRPAAPPQQPVSRPAAPAARPIDPRLSPQPATRQAGAINTAVNKPAPPPPSVRAVKPSLPTPTPTLRPNAPNATRVAPSPPPPVESEEEYGTAGEVEDALDRSFGDLAARGIIEQ